MFKALPIAFDSPYLNKRPCALTLYLLKYEVCKGVVMTMFRCPQPSLHEEGGVLNSPSSIHLSVHPNDFNLVSTLIITPHVCDMSGVIVLTLSLCVSRSHSRTDRHKDVNFGMEVKWGISRSSSKIVLIGHRSRSLGKKTVPEGAVIIYGRGWGSANLKIACTQKLPPFGTCMLRFCPPPQILRTEILPLPIGANTFTCKFTCYTSCQNDLSH